MNPDVERGMDPLQLAELLKKNVSLFKILPESDVATLLTSFEGIRLHAGQELWHEGDPSDLFAYVLSGSLQIKKDTEFKGKQVVVGVMSRGALVGELSFLGETPRPLTVEALEDSLLAVFSRQDYVLLEESRPDLALALVKNMLLAVSRRLQKSYERLAAIF